MSKPKMVRQGDVLLLPVPRIPERRTQVAREQGRLVLAHGEVTGHAHVVEGERAELVSVEAGRGSVNDTRPVSAEGARELYLLVHGSEPALLRHEEHDTIELAPGTYRVVRQREYEPDTSPRLVID